jgi:hypothetical protein
VGSLASLPYALAEAEQNFLVPAKTQALIWGDLVPQMILSAKIPRWWTSPRSRFTGWGYICATAASLMAEAAVDAKLAREVRATLSRLASPARTAAVAAAGSEGEVQEAAEETTPAELFLIARVLAPRRGGDGSLPWATNCAACERDNPQGSQLRRHLARVRLAQAYPFQFLSAGAAQSAHVSHSDGLLQPHHGRELGIEHAVLGGAGRRVEPAIRPSSMCASRNGPASWWSIFSPPTWRIGPPC